MLCAASTPFGRRLRRPFRGRGAWRLLRDASPRWRARPHPAGQGDRAASLSSRRPPAPFTACADCRLLCSRPVPTTHYIIDGGQASDSRCPSRKQRPLPTGGRSLRQALGSHSFGRPWAKILRAAGALQPPGDRRRPTSSPRSLLLASHALVSAGPDSPVSHTPTPPTHSLSPRRPPRPSLSA